MGRASVKENKSLFQLKREELGLSREQASELLGTISPDRIEKIENEKLLPHPEDILAMAEGYKDPHLCNYYCARKCPIGKQYVPEIKVKDLSQIILEMVASLNAMRKKQERLIEIAEDGNIDDSELDDFIDIQDNLEKISITVETLQLWSEKMLAEGKINMKAYQSKREQHADRL